MVAQSHMRGWRSGELGLMSSRVFVSTLLWNLQCNQHASS